MGSELVASEVDVAAGVVGADEGVTASTTMPVIVVRSRKRSTNYANFQYVPEV